MSITKVVSFLSGSDAPATSPRAARRIREAAEEPIPLEQLVLQLREMFTARHERICEARFDEMLDILDEQKSGTEIEVKALAQSIALLDGKVEDDYQLLSEVFRDSLAKTRGELEEKMDSLAKNLRASITDVDKALRSSLTSHLADNEVKRQHDRDQTMTTLEQRIAQWRAEIEDLRRDDMEEVASSMMDIGKRLLAIRKG